MSDNTRPNRVYIQNIFDVISEVYEESGGGVVHLSPELEDELIIILQQANEKLKPYASDICQDVMDTSCLCEEGEVCGICHKRKGYVIKDRKLIKQDGL